MQGVRTTWSRAAVLALAFTPGLGFASTVSHIHGEGAGPHAVTDIDGREFRYDANGSATFNGTFAFEYGVHGKASRVTQNGVDAATFLYDEAGDRIAKLSGGVTTLYFGDVVSVEEAKTVYYEAGSQKIAESDSDGVRFMLSDHLGSTSVMVDNSGTVLSRTKYYPFGDQRPETDAPVGRFTFTGQESDGEIGLMNYNARSYDPTALRFMQADSMIPDPSNPQDLNRYTYVGNNPVNLTDSSGHAAHIPIVLAAGAVVGAGFNLWRHRNQLETAGDWLRYGGSGALGGVTAAGVLLITGSPQAALTTGNVLWAGVSGSAAGAADALVRTTVANETPEHRSEEIIDGAVYGGLFNVGFFGLRCAAAPLIARLRPAAEAADDLGWNYEPPDAPDPMAPTARTAASPTGQPAKEFARATTEKGSKEVAKQAATNNVLRPAMTGARDRVTSQPRQPKPEQKPEPRPKWGPKPETQYKIDHITVPPNKTI